ncbi:MAG: galactitol-1-phosphate 5-dehydrogenase [Clostridiales bacterium]|nr:galactitol-1-phosphate 5-dehydrogenase [Clostridiales bacterium]
MRALVYQGPRDLRLEEYPMPACGAEDVRIAVEYCGICGSDVHGYLGTTGRKIPPLVMGHEFSGSVDAVGSSVARFKPGDRVTVVPVKYCGECEYCLSGLTNICPNRTFLGVFSEGGAMCEYLSIDQRYVLPLPDGVDYMRGALVEPFAVAYRAVKAAEVRGKSVLILGAGTIGLLLIEIARHAGARFIAATDLSDDRLGLARRAGADLALNPAQRDLAAEAREMLGSDRFDATIEAVGATPTVRDSIRYLKNKGTAVWVGNAAPFVEVPMQEIVTRELTVRGTYIYSNQDFEESLALIGDGSFDLDYLVSEIVGMEEAVGMFDRLASGAGKLIKVLISMRR